MADNKDHKYVISLSNDEWEDCMRFTSKNSKHRIRFNSHFDNLISKKLQEKGVNCILRSTYNWFNRKKNGCQWSGKFKCFSANCKRIYIARIWSIVDNCSVEVHIDWLFECNHPRLKIQPRVSGDERKEIGKQLLVHTIEEVLEQSEINKFVNENGNVLHFLQS